MPTTFSSFTKKNFPVDAFSFTSLPPTSGPFDDQYRTLGKKKRRAERVRKRVFVRAETCVLFYDPECDRFAVNHCGSFVATRKGR